MKLLTLTLALLAAWVLNKTRRDYETHGRLSATASLGGWLLYVTHLLVTLNAALHPKKTLPLHRDASLATGGSLVLFGVWLFTTAVRESRSFEQISGTETGNLVKSGPYRYSRNPQILGWGLTLLGASIAGRSQKALLLTAAFFFLHRIYLVSEERHLERTFGEEYRRYRAKTPRFLGLPQ